MGEIVCFPVPSRGGAVRRALDEVPSGPDQESAGVARGARELARHTTVHHRLDAFTRQCRTVLKPKTGPEAEVISIAAPRSGGGPGLT